MLSMLACDNYLLMWLLACQTLILSGSKKKGEKQRKEKGINKKRLKKRKQKEKRKKNKRRKKKRENIREGAQCIKGKEEV